jgi:adenosylcobinamide-phosphate synthase
MDMAWYVLPIAYVSDLAIGDPGCLPHPVRWMGKAIETAEARFRKFPIPLSISGLLFALFLIFSTWILTLILLRVAGCIHPVIKGILEILLIYYSISVRSLESSAMAVYGALRNGDVSTAKEKLAMIVGRDVAPLSEEGMIRASVETVAENLVDGVISPLFYAAVGGAPLAIAYKMINTLDSMVGYKNEKYEKFGKASARIDDLANYIPARLSVFVIALAAEFISCSGIRALKTGFYEGRRHSSPNSGYPEAAFAGVLDVRLGGPNSYGGQWVSKPYIGEKFGNVTINDIPRACDIMILSSFLWFLVVCGI